MSVQVKNEGVTSSQSAMLTDGEIHAELKKRDPDYKESGKLTDTQRQIKLKRIHHYEVKEDKQKAEELKKNMAAIKAAAKADSVKAHTEVSSQKLNEPQEKRSRGGKRKSTVQTKVVITPEKVVSASQYNGSQQALTTCTSQSKEIFSSSLPVSLSGGRVDSCLTISVTDSIRGLSASHLKLTLSGLDKTNTWIDLAQRETDENGECPGLITQSLFQPGLYRLHFDTADYFRSAQLKSFFPAIEVMFEIEKPHESHRILLFISQYGYSTYKA